MNYYGKVSRDCVLGFPYNQYKVLGDYDGKKYDRLRQGKGTD